MNATRFMRIPFFVTGYPVTVDNMEALAKWCEGYVVRSADGRSQFIRVPVERATSKKQTEAYPGSWLIVSNQRGNRSFKVYTEEWLRKQFVEMPEDFLMDSGIPQDILVEEPEEKRTPPANVRPLPTQFKPPTSNKAHR